MDLTRLPVLALACTALAAPYGAALADDSALTPLQVPAKTLPVPADVSPELQKIIAAPRNSMISPVIETHAAVMPRKCTRAMILTADSLTLIDPSLSLRRTRANSRFAITIFVRCGRSMGNEV